MANRYPFVAQLDLDSHARSALTQNLDRTVSGSDENIRTPFMKGSDEAQILSDWDSVFNKRAEELEPELLEIEQTNRLKFGPRSIAKSWKDRLEATKSYFSNSGGDGAQFSKAELPKGSLRPLSLAKATEFLVNSSSSGLPYMMKKRFVKKSLLSEFTKILERRDPCVLYTRTQEAQKTRAVWGFPVADTLNELRYYRPLLEFQKKLPWRSVLTGPEQVDQYVTRMLRSLYNDGGTLVSVDFSSYDQTVGTALQNLAFQYIRNIFQKSTHSEIDYIAERFNSIGLVTPDGVWSGEHGVPSGSTFTNEVDSIVQYLLGSQFTVRGISPQIQGDDGLYLVDDPNKLLTNFVKSGLRVNDEKSVISDKYCTYLQLFYSPHKGLRGAPTDFTHIGGIYSTYRALNRIVHQERWSDFMEYDVTGRDYYSIRAISILENCRNHPMYTDLVKFVVNNDRYRLSYSDNGLHAYVHNMLGKGSREVVNQYGDRLTGLKSFKTVQLIAEL